MVERAHRIEFRPGFLLLEWRGVSDCEFDERVAK
jgi:hypothetical protein